jgi:gliding motility associated protien GldN
VPYTPLREADVMFAKRVWRTIDLREKMNHQLYYPLEPSQGRKSLFQAIRDGLLRDGALTAYDAGVLLEDDGFTKELTLAEVQALLDPVDTVWTASLEDPEVNVPVVQPASIKTEHVTRYQLKEDWFFDKQRGVMEVRIIGLAPMREVRGEDGELRGYAPLFWLYFPELRYVLANVEGFNPANDGERRSLDHVFQDRRFSSWITKESNVYDRRIIHYADGVEALLEAERVKEELFQAEHDLWNY